MFESNVSGHRKATSQVLRVDGWSRSPLRLELATLSGNSKANRAGSDLQLSDADSQRGKRRQRSLHQRLFGASINRRDSSHDANLIR